MIDEGAIERQLKLWISQIGLAEPIEYPNESQGGIPPLPYVFMQLVRFPNFDPTLGGGSNERHSGQMILTLVSRLGVGTSQPNATAKQIAEFFPKGKSATTPENIRVVVINPATILGGYRDQGMWRTPVTIPYEAA